MNLLRRTVLRALVVLPTGILRTNHDLAVHDVRATDGPELDAALRNAGPGTVITLAPGDYGGLAQFEIAASDVTLRADASLRSVLRTPVVVTGARAKLVDLAFHGDGSDGLYLSAVAACSDLLSISAPDVEVRGCDFAYFGARAILVRPTGLRPYIHDCTFHDNRNGGGNHNAHEAISLGYDNPSSGVSMRAHVVANRLWKLNIEGEGICVKTSDNIIERNEIMLSRGAFTNRYGERNLFIENTTTNSRGFAIGDRGNRLIGNTVNGGGSIRIRGGNAGAGVTQNGPHIQATDTYLEGNTGSMVVGYNYNGETLPAVNTFVESHNGVIRLMRQVGIRLPRQVS